MFQLDGLCGTGNYEAGRYLLARICQARACQPPSAANREPNEIAGRERGGEATTGCVRLSSLNKMGAEAHFPPVATRWNGRN